MAPIAAAQLDVIAKSRRVIEVFEQGSGYAAALSAVADLKVSIATFDRVWTSALELSGLSGDRDSSLA